MRLDDLRLKRDEVDSEIRLLGTRQELTRGEQERFDRGLRQRDRLTNEMETLEARNARVSDLRANFENGHGRMVDGTETFSAPDVRATARNTEMAGALRSIEAGGRDLPAAAQDRCEALVRSGDSFWHRWVEIHGRPEYNSAFGKLTMSGDAGLAGMQMNDSERAAMADSFELRAQAEGTTTTGGFAVPVFIDPSVILTNQETPNPFLTLAKQVDITTNAWKGVSAAGMSWSFDAEAAEVSDDSVTIAQPSVTVFMARGFIPFSIEVGEDWPGFQMEMGRLMSAGYDELLVSKFSTGSGTGEPRGILTALAASSPTVIVTSTTDGAFGQEDIYAAWSALPAKHRAHAAWMMDVTIQNKIRQFGTAVNYQAFTVGLQAGAIESLLGAPVYNNPYFPVFSSTTGASNRLVVGNWDNYVIARRTGMTVELVPHLFATANNRPTGSRGFFAYARIGANSVNDDAFRLLANT